MGQRKTRREGDARVAVGYIRVSTSEQALGPEAQREALGRWCATQGVRLAAIHEDRGVSGGAPIDRRPGLLAAVDALGAHGAGLLLVAKRDRLARDTLLAAMVERLAEREGARVRSADGVGEGDSPEAQLMRRMVDAFAEYERSVIRARTRAALAVKRGRGLRVGSVPYGHRLAADGKALERHEGEQRVLSEVRASRAQGLTLRATGERLEACGLLPRSGKRWHPQTVARIAGAA